MTLDKLNKLMDTLLGISSIIVIVGAVLKLQHIEGGSLIFWSGIWVNFVLSSYEIRRLRKIIAQSGNASVSEENSTTN